MKHESGELAGAGSFRCETCGLAVTLRERDSLPRCPGCGGDRFEQAPMFGSQSVEVATHEPDHEPPEWLDGAREAVGEEGDYLAFDDGDEIRTVALDDGWTRIGRSLTADVRIDDPTVSRRHALVHRDGDTARVLDDRSLNGTLHNGQRIDLGQLSDGDTITVGRFTLHYLQLSNDRQPSLA
jgi:hypothetical protein